MRGRTPFARLLVFSVVLIGALMLPAKALASPFEAKIHVLPFNYTEAIVVECNGHFGIVDSGEDNSYPDGSDQRYPLREGIIIGCGVEDKVIPYLWKIGVRPGNLDFYIGTHPHSDHIGSASQIIQMFKPSRIYTPSYDDSYITDEDHLWDNQYVYDRLIEAAHEAEGEYGAQLIQNFTYLNRSFMLGGAFIQLYNTGTDYQTTGVFDANCFSLGVKVTVGTHSAFLGGDINDFTGVEDELASQVGSVDFLKMGHHGCSGSNTAAYLDALSPLYVFQTGKYSILPAQTAQSLANLGSRYASADDVCADGIDAYVVTLAATGVTTNFDYSKPRVYYSEEAGAYRCYQGGLPNASFTGWIRGDGGWLWFDRSSEPFRSSWVSDGGAWYYVGADGLMCTGWKRIGSSWYYFDASGAMATGWRQVDGSWSFFASSGQMQTGWVLDGASWYWLDSSGQMQVGWQRVGGSWYCLDSGGAMATGWLRLGGSWYWLGSSGAMATGWQKVAGEWYYLDADGAMVTGWEKVSGLWYHFSGSGQMSTGWLDLDGSWYYLGTDGAMVMGTEWIDGVEYQFGPTGALLGA